MAYEPVELIVGRVQDRLADLKAERGVETTSERPYDIVSSAVSERYPAVLRDAAAATDVQSFLPHSGVDHDMMHMASVTETGILFTPSCGGFSATEHTVTVTPSTRCRGSPY